jgi:hypothetical protein
MIFLQLKLLSNNMKIVLRVASFILIFLQLSPFSLAIEKKREFVANVTKNLININSNFQGKNVVVFGYNYNNNNSIVIEVDGGTSNYLVKMSEKKYNFLWLIGNTMRFSNVSSYKFFAKNKNKTPESVLFDQNIKLEINNNNKENLTYYHNSKEALFNFYKKNYLFSEEIDSKDKVGNLFSFNFFIPPKIKDGVYIISVYNLNESDAEEVFLIPIIVSLGKINSAIISISNIDIVYIIIILFSSIFIGIFIPFVIKFIYNSDK